MFNVNGKIAVVTGGTGGIGLACAARLARAGAQVWIAGRHDGSSAAATIGAHFATCDVTDEGAVRSTMSTIAEAHGRIDTLVIAAGVEIDPKRVVDHDIEDLRTTYDINVLGATRAIKYAVPFMPRGGSIITIGSIGGEMGLPGHGDHVISRFAINGLSRSAAIDLGPSGIRVNTVCPGVVRTAWVDNSDSWETVAAVALSETASDLGVLVDPDDIAALVHFLASDDSSRITGQELSVDAGFTSGMSIGVYDTIMRSRGLPEFAEMHRPGRSGDGSCDLLESRVP